MPCIYYDDRCALCRVSASFAKRRDKEGKLIFLPLSDHPEYQEAKSVVLKEDSGAEYTRSDAVLRIISHLGGRWRLAKALLIIPRFLRDGVYNFISRHRHRVTR